MSFVSKLLPPRLRDKPEFKALADSINELFEKEVSVYPRQIENLRSPKLIEKEFLSLLGGLLGFNIDTHFFVEEDYRRFLNLLTTYYNQSGTKALPQFISYTNRSIFRYDVRWTDDYKKFLPLPQGQTIYEGGTWLMTPHVDVLYDGTKTNMIFKEVEELFYELSPIHLVMEGLVRAFLLDDKQFYIAGANRDHEWEYSDWEPLTANFYASATSLDRVNFVLKAPEVFEMLQMYVTATSVVSIDSYTIALVTIPIIDINDTVQPLMVSIAGSTIISTDFTSNKVTVAKPTNLFVGGKSFNKIRIYMRG